jgi:2-oxoisovalerate dehydrogenase E1 component beta subunit
VLIVHEDNVTGGIGAELAAIVGQEAFEYLDGPITRLCGPDVPAWPFAPSLEQAVLLTPEKIAESIRTLAAY